MEELLQKLSKEVRELSLGTTGEVERVEGPLSPLQFLRDFVLPGKPCIITGAIDFWPALTKWSNKYLASTLRDEFVSVHFTPDGRADSLIDPKFYENDTLSEFSEPDSNCQSGNPKEDELIFVTAHVENMSFPAALDTILASNAADGVAYAQQQNNCFISEYKLLHLDAELHIPWATEALGCLPEAVNLWIGNEKSVTSFHKDHYENLYAVVAGEKHFTLLPPVDVHRLYIKGYSSGTYVRSSDMSDLLYRA